MDRLIYSTDKYLLYPLDIAVYLDETHFKWNVAAKYYKVSIRRNS